MRAKHTTKRSTECEVKVKKGEKVEKPQQQPKQSASAAPAVGSVPTTQPVEALRLLEVARTLIEQANILLLKEPGQAWAHPAINNMHCTSSEVFLFSETLTFSPS